MEKKILSFLGCDFLFSCIKAPHKTGIATTYCITFLRLPMSTASSSDVITSISALKRRKNHNEALALLNRIAAQVSSSCDLRVSLSDILHLLTDQCITAGEANHAQTRLESPSFMRVLSKESESLG